MSELHVVKLGGSLLDLPDLRERLLAVLSRLDGRLALLVGGGPTTDAIRLLDRIHHLGDATAHNLALRALTVNAHVVRAILGQGRVVGRRADVIGDELKILDPWALLNELELEVGNDLLPHTWDATSDSVALVLAHHLGATALTLLKSVGPSGPLDPGGVHPPDIVDPCFARLREACPGLRVAVWNCRSG